jgi:hypothetical protein
MTHPLLVDDAVIDEVFQFSVEKAVIERYFSTLNQAQFQEAATLFDENGMLFPPFDEPVSGQKAIASYLLKEADGIQIMPQQFIFEPTTDGKLQVRVRGRVKMIVFEVNVGWIFLLNSQIKIEQVRVNLLASLEELLHLRSQTDCDSQC